MWNQDGRLQSAVITGWEMCVRGAWGEQRVAVASARARAAALAESTMQSSSH